jgi:hypothetical protein
VELSLNVTFRLEATVVVAIAAGVLNVGAAIAAKVCRHKMRRRNHRCCRRKSHRRQTAAMLWMLHRAEAMVHQRGILMPYGGLIEVDLSHFRMIDVRAQRRRLQIRCHPERTRDEAYFPL